MFDFLSIFQSSNTSNVQFERKLTYVKNERMGGFVPKYERMEKTSGQDSIANVDFAGAQGQDTLSNKSKSDDQFGFADLLDMVNPLHHIPVVGHFYREFTGDEIKPIGKMVGGAAFGGPLGVATALIDSVIINETGSDMTGNAFSLASGNGFSQKEQNFDDAPITPTIQTASNNIEPASGHTSGIEDTVKQDNEMVQALLAYSNLQSNDNAVKALTAQSDINIFEAMNES